MKNNRYLKLIGALQETVSTLDYRIPLSFDGEVRPYFACVVSDKDNLFDFRTHLTKLEDEFWEEVEDNMGQMEPEEQSAYLQKINRKIVEIINKKVHAKASDLETISKIALSRLEEKGDLPEVRFAEEPGEFMISQIKKLHSIYDKVKARIDMISQSQQAKETTPFAPSYGGTTIDWKDQLNLLCTLFYDLLEEGYIEAGRTELERWIVDSFTSNGKEVNVTSVKTILRPDKPDKRVKSSKRIIVPKRRK